MSEYKRSINEVSDAVSTHDDKKHHTKPGRKPIDTEPKSKRTAQNRAAQRAYRERKEQKMKDLEDKVSLLEDSNIKALEKIELLKSELRRYRGHSDFSDLNLPKTPMEIPKSIKREPAVKPEPNDSVQESIWSSNTSSSSYIPSNSSGSHIPDLVSGSSSSTTPLNDNVHVSPESNASDNYHFPTGQVMNNLFEEEPNQFCASLNEACGTKQKPQPKYQRAPVTDFSQEYTGNNFLHNVSIDSPFSALTAPNTDLSDPFFNSLEFGNNFTSNTDNFQPNAENPDLSRYLNELNDDKFDISLALGNQAFDPVTDGNQPKTADPLSGLVHEESAYDPLNSVNTDFNYNEFVKSSYTTSESSRSNSVAGGAKALSSITSFDSPRILEENEEQETVPAPEQTLKCSEIWDRVTAHPKYGEIDIDGLCNELKSKAKCSEKGVVLNASDVHHLLEKSAMGRH